jgi:hypothetical protein
VKLDTKEASLLIDMIDLSIDGHKEAKQAMTTDPQVASAELLVDVGNDIDNTIDTLEGIKKKVTANA